MKNIHSRLLFLIFLCPYVLAAQSTGSCFSQNSALMDALFGADRTVAYQAAACLKKATFTKDDLPLLHETLLKMPGPGLFSWEVNDVIRDRIVAINDSSSFRFAAGHYKNVADSTDFIKAYLVQIMAHFPTTAHYKEMGDLLQYSPPRHVTIEVFLELQTNLRFTAAIMPKLMYLFDNKLARPYMADIAGMMVTRKLLTAEIIRPWQPAILKYAIDEAAFLSTDHSVPRTSDYALIDLLGLLGTPEAIATRKSLVSLTRR